MDSPTSSSPPGGGRHRLAPLCLSHYVGSQLELSSPTSGPSRKPQSQVLSSLSTSSSMPDLLLHSGTEIDDALTSSSGSNLRLGISGPARRQNLRSQHSFDVLAADTHAQRPTRDTIVQPCMMALLQHDEHKFLSNADKIDAALAELKHNMHTFNPLLGIGSRTGSGSAALFGGRDNACRRTGGRKAILVANSAEKGGPEHDLTFAERFQAYKMVRRIEPELTPLTPQECSPTTRRACEQSLVRRNASAPALHQWSPQARRQRSQTQQDEREEKAQLVACRGQAMLEAMTSAYSCILLQKARKADLAKKAKKSGRKNCAIDVVVAERWACAVAVVQFITAMRDKAAATHQNSLPAPEVSCHSLEQTVVDVECCRGFLTMIAMYRFRKALRNRRESAVRVRQALASWGPTGRLFSALRRTLLRIVFVQRWWRDTSRALHEVRDQLARRWERLEKQRFVKEPRKTVPRGPLGTGGSQCSSSGKNCPLSPHGASNDHHHWTGGDRLTPEARSRFLEHELRIRRYLLLPRIELWEADFQRWHEGITSKIEDNVARRVMGDRVDPARLQWRPVRPSYLPPAHPASEASTGVCSIDCRGRRGDEEIMDMITRAYRFQNAGPNAYGGWLPFPVQFSGPAGRAKAKAADENRKKRAQLSGSAFGYEVSEAEMEAWGVGDFESTDARGPEDINQQWKLLGLS